MLSLLVWCLVGTRTVDWYHRSHSYYFSGCLETCKCQWRCHRLEGWSSRGKRSCRFHELHSSIMARESPHPENDMDVVLWKHESDDFRNHSPLLGSKWDLSGHGRVKSSSLVRARVPRFSFITWLATKNRLSTGDGMRQWEMVQNY